MCLGTGSKDLTDSLIVHNTILGYYQNKKVHSSFCRICLLSGISWCLHIDLADFVVGER